MQTSGVSNKCPVEIVRVSTQHSLLGLEADEDKASIALDKHIEVACPLVQTGIPAVIVDEHCDEALKGCVRWKPADFVWKRIIAHGTSCEVWVVEHRITRTSYVVKRFDKLAGNIKLNRIYKEAQIHSQLAHPYILNFYGYMESNDFIGLLLEYLPRGDLFDCHLCGERVKKVGMPPNQLMRRYLAQLCHALHYCHTRGVVHADIKSENLLLGDDDCLKLADFGSAMLVHDSGSNVFAVGTPEFLAPEVVSLLLGNQSPSRSLPTPLGRKLRDILSPALDMWSVGILAYELFSLHSPFFDRRGGLQPSETELTKALERMETDVIEQPPRERFWIDENSLDWIAKLLTRQPDRRWSAERSLGHPTLSDFVDKSLVQLARLPIQNPVPLVPSGSYGSSESFTSGSLTCLSKPTSLATARPRDGSASENAACPVVAPVPRFATIPRFEALSISETDISDKINQHIWGSTSCVNMPTSAASC